MMTFEQYLTEHKDLYPTTAPLPRKLNDADALRYEAVKQALEDEFGLRKIPDADTFNRFYSRRFRRAYVQYNEMARVQPGYIEIDWLVTDYREREISHVAQNEINENGTTSAAHTGTVSNEGTTKQTHGGTVTENGTETENGTVKNTGTVTDAGTHDTTETRKLNSSDNGSDTTTHGHVINTAGSTDRTGSVTRQHAQSAVDNYDDTDGTDGTQYGKTVHTAGNDTPGVTDTTTTTAKQGTTTTSGSLAKANPMSVTYAAAGAGGADKNGIFTGSGMPVMDWTAPGSQGQNASITMPYGNDGDTQQVTHAGSNSSSSDETNGGSDTATHSSKTGHASNYTDTETYNGIEDTNKSTVTNSGNDVVAHANDHTDGGTVNNAGTDGNTKTNDLTAATDNTKTNTQTTTNDLTDEGTTTGTTTNNLTDSGTSSRQTAGKDASRDREQYTGRGGAPAELLARAVGYIEGTNALAWLIDQLAPCFMGVE